MNKPLPIILDCFPAFNETRLAAFRINYLRSFVDFTLIAESKLSHTGTDKPLYFKEWLKSQDSETKRRVIVIEVPLERDAGSWDREIFTREYLLAKAKEIYPGSRFILSDLDEIPSLEQVSQLPTIGSVVRFSTPTYYRRVNWQLRDSHMKWARGVMGDLDSNVYSNGGRFSPKLRILSDNPGAHFSWFGVDSDLLYKKSASIAHEELRKDYWKSEELLNFCDRYRINHLGGSRSKGLGVFRITDAEENSVVLAAKNQMPDLFDTQDELPNILMRVLASIKLTAFVNNSAFMNTPRKGSTIKFFKWSNLPGLVAVLIEIPFTFYAQSKILLKTIIKNFLVAK